MKTGSAEVGSISRIIFFASDSGYVVLQMERQDFSDFTAVGTMPDAKEGMQVELMGEWKNHPKFGEQFSFVAYDVPAPTEEKGMIAYLSTLKGVGEGLAGRIINYFGLDQVLDVLEKDSDRLLEVPGIGKKTLPKIVESFMESKGLRILISFLAEVGVSASYAPRIYKVYGSAAIAEIKRDPYILAEEVRGFGFKRADEIAIKMGILPDSPFRAIAGILHCLKTAANMHGHCYLRKETLLTDACDVLALPDYRPQMGEIEKTINRLQVVSTKKAHRLVIDGDRVYLYGYFEAEEQLAEKIRQLAGTIPVAMPDESVARQALRKLLEKAKCEGNSSKVKTYSKLLDEPIDPLFDWIAEYEAENDLQLSNGQKAAIVAANRNGLTVMTGGAGVGKTAVAKAVMERWHKQGKRIVACAPTGKAAQRIREATGLMSASTIHRLLGWNGHGFDHDQFNPIEGDAFLIDEFSMTDLKLANALFQAIPPHAIVLIVGDVNQLPSVGAGNVLRDIIESHQIPVVRLTETFRQAATSRIIQASLAINDGKFPVLEQLSRASGTPQSDALWIKCSADRIPAAISWLLTDKLREMGWQPDDIQVLSPMHKGDIGNIALNALIQRIWNPERFGAAVMGYFREGDRVIQTFNDYDKKVFNGDIGKIELINTTDKEVNIRFADLDNPLGRVVTYGMGDLENLMLAYSISVHKAQGSEFPVVVMPCAMSQYMMLQRNLYYTGVTRGKKLVILVGEEQAIQTAVRTQRLNQRNTALAERIERD